VQPPIVIALATRDALPCPQSSEDPEFALRVLEWTSHVLEGVASADSDCRTFSDFWGRRVFLFLGRATGRWKRPRRPDRRGAHAATPCSRSARTVIEARSTVGCRARDPRDATACNALGAGTARARKGVSTTGTESGIAAVVGDSSARAWGITLPSSPRRVPESSPPPPNPPPWSPFRIGTGSPRFPMFLRSLPIRVGCQDCAASAAHAFAAAYGEAFSVACEDASRLEPTRDGDST